MCKIAIARYDEVLGKALSSDATPIPRYTIKNAVGTVIAENVSLELTNNIIQAGTPINALALNEMLAASGVTAGSAGVFDLTQENFILMDGATVRCRLNIDATAGATLNVNDTGDKPILRLDGEVSDFKIAAGTWATLIYSEALSGWVLQGWSTKSVQRTQIFTSSQTWNVPAGVTSVLIVLVGGGGGGGAGSEGFYDYKGSGGGGGSGEIKRQTVSVTPGQQITVTIGKGGAGGIAGSSIGGSGSNGGVSSFGSLLSCSGGSGGGGGRAYGNYTNAYGGNGGNGGAGGGGGSGSRGGNGGNGSFGGGGGGARGNYAGSGSGGNGGIYGGGGGGAYVATTNGIGGTYGGDGGNPAQAGTNTTGLVDDFPGDGAAGKVLINGPGNYGNAGGGGYGGRGGNARGAGGAGGGGWGGNGGDNNSASGSGGGGYGAAGKSPGSPRYGGAGGGGYGLANYGAGGTGSSDDTSGTLDGEAGTDGICVIMYTEQVA